MVSPLHTKIIALYFMMNGLLHCGFVLRFSASSKYQNTSSAVCIFSLSEIDRRFDENIHNCLNGSTIHRNMEYISGTISEGKCPEKVGAAGNILNFCEVGLKISGTYPIVSNPVYITNHEAVTSVHYSDIHGQPNIGVLILGSSTGNVKSIVMSSTSNESDDLRVLATQALSEADPVIKLMLTPQQDHIIVSSKNTV